MTSPSKMDDSPMFERDPHQNSYKLEVINVYETKNTKAVKERPWKKESK